MRATSEKYRLNSYDGEELPFENYMKRGVIYRKEYRNDI